MREYTRSQTIVANLPYGAMVVLGTATIAFACGFSARALVAAGGYFAYGIIGALWVMAFVCPYCAHYATRECPCGYGIMSASLVAKGDRISFPEKFRRHIPVIIPLWLIPVAFGGIAAWYSFSWWLIVLISGFVIESWVILPIVSRSHACVGCPQEASCPWMARGARQEANGNPGVRC